MSYEAVYTEIFVCTAGNQTGIAAGCFPEKPAFAFFDLYHDFFMELFNIARVLFWSRSGLDSVNNRIYFGLYCALLLSAALYLLLDRLFGSVLHGCSRPYSMVPYSSFFCGMHCSILYDLMRDPFGGTGVFVTAVLAVGSFYTHAGGFQHHRLCSDLCIVPASFPLQYDERGDIINLTFSTIVALAVSLTDMHNLSTIISQRRALENANAQLQAMSQKRPAYRPAQ